ncbi:purine-cytosine permease family protein [Salinisphaera hydrothermalis]|uniref:purine-cytosine permease family protein n=1 Tax=Salinisphaera hydrothermalis TaxID=563188 RepID=UPI003342C063
MSSTMNVDGTASDRRGVVEVRSIDYVPKAERHGKVWHQGPFWFTGNFVLTTMVTGFVGPSMGLGVWWSVLAVVLGAAFGTFFMAFHANQGPRLGLPQMIQSRAQFGSRGAILPFAATIFVYCGFNVFNVILATEALRLVLPGGPLFWYPLLVLLAIGIAVVGHDLLHFVQRWLTPILIAVFAVLTIGAIVMHGHAAVHQSGAGWAVFLVQFSAAAGYQISYAVYVSDYSRYLPSNVSSRGVISWTYLGAGGSAIWLMSLGAFLSAALPHPEVIASLRSVGNDILPGFGTFAVLASVPALISVMAVNMYGAMLTGISTIDAYRPVRPTISVRVIGIVLFGALATAVALVIPDAYLGSFNNFVILMLYFLVPWTAVNLIDFYVVRHGRYAITEIFNPRGIYGQWSWRGMLAYAVGFVAMIPFFAISFYTGPVTRWLGGADISFLVGLVVAGGLYWILASGIDTAAEKQAIADSNRMLAQRKGG